MRTPILAPLALLLVTAFAASGQQPDADAILQKTAAIYRDMKSFSSTGFINVDMKSKNGDFHTVTTFSILLKKPNLYLVTWEQNNATMPITNQSGAVWSDGTQPYLYMGIAKSYSKIRGDDMALGAATGISGGAANTIPFLFLPVFGKESGIKLKGAAVTGTESVEGDSCYVITGSNAAVPSETYWISATSSLIRKFSRSLSQPKGSTPSPQITDQQLESSLKAEVQAFGKATGQEPTADQIATLRKILKQSEASVKNLQISGSSTETYEKIDTPQLTPQDFQFKLPGDVVLKSSPFGF